MSFVQWKEGKKEGRKVKVEVVEVVEVVRPDNRNRSTGLYLHGRNAHGK